MRNIIAERVLGLPAEPRTDTRCPGRTCPDDDHRLQPDPAAPTFPDLRYQEAENELRAAVRDLLDGRSPWPSVLARTESDGPNDAALWHSLAAELGCAGLLIPESLGGAGATYREAAVVAEETGRAVAPVPYLGSPWWPRPRCWAAGDELLPGLAEGR